MLAWNRTQNDDDDDDDDDDEDDDDDDDGILFFFTINLLNFCFKKFFVFELNIFLNFLDFDLFEINLEAKISLS